VPGETIAPILRMCIFTCSKRKGEGGLSTRCVRDTIRIYFGELEFKQLLCEPNDFNVAPNRALQRGGFKYVKTHMTVPGPLNLHQAVTQWVERQKATFDRGMRTAIGKDVV
jgi:hypothetical protein